MVQDILLTWNEAFSGILGSISLAAWIFLLLPQLFENYRQGNADGISITFILIWAAGDVCNLIGALWANLVPTVIALAVYFCFADGTLILQCWYYAVINRSRGQEEEEETPTETSPLLNGTNKPANTIRRSFTDVRPDNLGLPGSRRRSSEAARRHSIAISNHSDFVPMKELGLLERVWIKNTLAVLAIIAIGALGWLIAWKTGTWKPVPTSGNASEHATPLGAELLGYASAVLYLGARIPQIIKNQRERSCDGLSLLFFILSLLGNATYGAGILFHSIEKEYVLTNLPWLIGSLGTMVEDAVIFAQFSAFGEQEATVDTAD